MSPELQSIFNSFIVGILTIASASFLAMLSYALRNGAAYIAHTHRGGIALVLARSIIDLLPDDAGATLTSDPAFAGAVKQFTDKTGVSPEWATAQITAAIHTIKTTPLEPPIAMTLESTAPTLGSVTNNVTFPQTPAVIDAPASQG